MNKISLYACILVFCVISCHFPTGITKFWINDRSSCNFKLVKLTLKPLGVFCFVLVSPFLLGRALWAASRFTVAMSPELIQQFLQATVSGLHETQPPSVRISAVRAIWG